MAEKHMIITIGRQFGSGGHQIARIVADKLGLNLYDGELFDQAAKKVGENPDKFRKMDESRTLRDRILSPGDNRYATTATLYDDILAPMKNIDAASRQVNRTMEYARTVQDNLYMFESELIKEAAKEPCVIVGHCGNFVLRDYPNVFRVFVFAPLDFKVKRVMAEDPSMSRDAAIRFIQKKDKNRKNYHEFYTPYRWGTIDGLDMLINSGLYGVEKAADIVADVAKKTLA